MTASPPVTARIREDLSSGHLRSATGSFGRFAIRVDAYRALVPAGRGPHYR